VGYWEEHSRQLGLLGLKYYLKEVVKIPVFETFLGTQSMI